MFDAFTDAWAVEHVGMQSVDDEPALFFILHQTSVTQDAEMVRDVDDLGAEHRGQLADVARAAAQTINDS
jgi:hypothetical protein